MKKLFSTAIITSLFIPSLLLAQTNEQGVSPNQMMRAVPVRGTLLREGVDNLRKPLQASTTRGMMERQPRDGRASTTPQNGFCSQIDKALIMINERGGTAAAKRADGQAARENKRTETRSEVDTHRSENNAKKDAQLAELNKRATTEEQKNAIATFTKSLTDALTIRNKAVDALLLAHRNDVDAAVASRKEAMDKALATLSSDIEKAKTQAKTDCANNLQGDVVRNTLKTSIMKAQETFKTTVGTIEKVRDVSEASRTAKKDELAKIEATFKKSIDAARNNLKETMKQSRQLQASTSPQR